MGSLLWRKETRYKLEKQTSFLSDYTVLPTIAWESVYTMQTYILLTQPRDEACSVHLLLTLSFTFLVENSFKLKQANGEQCVTSQMGRLDIL